MINVLLSYPDGYLGLAPEKKAKICNGAGAANGLKFPNTMYGLDLKEIFDIHDYGYHIGRTIKDKEREDRRMLNNGLRLINAEDGFWGTLLQPLRRRRMLKYYEAVHHFGGPAFWKGKENVNV